MNALRILVFTVVIIIAWLIFSKGQQVDPPLDKLPVAEGQETAESTKKEEAAEVAAEIPESTAESTVEMPKGELLPAKLGGIKPVHKYGNIYLAGQPSQEDLVLLKQQGFKSVLSLRKEGEVSWDEIAETEKNGMQFVHVPFKGEAELTPEVFDKVRDLLRDEANQPMLFHCGSANRVGAIWYAYRVLDQQISHEQALEEAKAAGLRTPAYEEKAREYVLAEELLAGEGDSEDE